jgi:hypothetical protein
MGENCELHRHYRSGRGAGKTITQASCAQPFRHLAPPITESATQDPSAAPPRHRGPCLCRAYFSVGGIGCVTPARPRPPTPVPWTSRTSRSKTGLGVKGERFTPKAGGLGPGRSHYAAHPSSGCLSSSVHCGRSSASRHPSPHRRIYRIYGEPRLDFRSERALGDGRRHERIGISAVQRTAHTMI